MKVVKKLTLIALLMFIGGFIVLQASKITSYAAPAVSIQNDIADYNKKVKNKYTGWLKAKSKNRYDYNYYYMEKGNLVKGWKTIKNKKYYFKSDYKMAWGIESINNKLYLFGCFTDDTYGALITYPVIYSAYNNTSYNVNNVVPSKDGSLVKNGWVSVEKGYSNGNIVPASKAYIENYIAFNNGWKKISGKWYFFKGCRMQTGWIINSGKYYLNSNGVMVTGLQTINGKKYFFNDSGKMQIGWKKISGYWYYFKTDGSAITGTTTKIGNKTYSFRSNGTCINP